MKATENTYCHLLCGHQSNSKWNPILYLVSVPEGEARSNRLISFLTALMLFSFSISTWRANSIKTSLPIYKMINMLMILQFYRRVTRREEITYQIHPYYGDEALWRAVGTGLLREIPAPGQSCLQLSGCLGQNSLFHHRKQTQAALGQQGGHEADANEDRQTQANSVSRWVKRASTVMVHPQQLSEHLSFR